MLGNLRAIDIEQAFSTQPQRKQDFIVPEDIAQRLRPHGFGLDAFRQADSLGRFAVELRLDCDPSGSGEVGKNRLGVFFVLGRVDNYLAIMRGPAAGKTKGQQGEW